MLRLIPAPLHRVALRLAYTLRKVWLRWRKPELHGCSVVLRDVSGRVLLVRHSYGGHQWGLPGGGVRPGEEARSAALRELQEETGCRACGMQFVGRAERTFFGACNLVDIFTATTEDAPCADGREILEARFFAPDRLPEPLVIDTAAWIARADRLAAG